MFRIGGDEFVAILQNDDYRNRLELCTMFDRECVNISEVAENPWDAVNVASGIAVYDPEKDSGADDVYKRADDRMYEDKDRKKQGIIRELTSDMLEY